MGRLHLTISYPLNTYLLNLVCDQRARPSGMMVRAPSTGWASEFAAQHPMAAQGPPLGGAAAAPGAAWATEFAGGAAAPADTASAWAADFKSEQDTATAPGTQGQVGVAAASGC